MKMKQTTMIKMVIGVSLLAFVYGIIGLIGTYKLSNGCLLRYSDTSGLSKSRSSVDVKEFALRADGNYNFGPHTITSTDSNGNLVTSTAYGPDPNKYGQWYKVDTAIHDKQSVNIEVSGEVSLCKAYIPTNNIQKGSVANSDRDNTGATIPIPRTYAEAEPVPLILDPKNGEWRNLAHTYQGDRVEIYLGVNHLPRKDANGNVIAGTEVNNVGQANRFTNTTDYADCTEGRTTYSPICGRYSPYAGNYLSSCNMDDCLNWDYTCHGDNNAGLTKTYNKRCSDLSTSEKIEMDFVDLNPEESRECTAYGVKVYSSFPAYSSTSNQIATHDNNYSSLMDFDTKYNPSWRCESTAGQYGTINSTFPPIRGIWFQASDAAGLVYRFSSSNAIDSSLGSGYSFSNVPNVNRGTSRYKLIYSGIVTDASRPYFQYRLLNSAYVSASNSTGGYVLYVKQTKCRRENGAALTDPEFTERGRVKYLLLPRSTDNPNSTPSLANGATSITFADGKYDLPSNSTGYLWLKIDNKSTDYKDSHGSYNTKVTIKTPIIAGGLSLFTDILNLFQTKMLGLSETFLKNITCHGGDKSTCTNYFHYLRAMMILFIVSTALMFLMGVVDINQKELVIIVVKIAIVSGLMNEGTYNLLHSYFIPLVTGATNNIIANLEGMAMFAQTTMINDTAVVNPFTFVDELFARIFLDPTFMGQIVALLSFGSHGIIYFIIIIVTIIVAVIAIFRSVTAYIMAFVAQCLLLNLAPFFLTFMLFDYTRPLFDKWIRYFIRYALEPIILITGLIVFVQLFTLYLDYTINYSVCWKCALSFTIPFSLIPGLGDLALTKVPLFCLQWFVPWGQDSAGFPMLGGELIGANFTNIVALLVIAYGMNGYIDLADSMMSKLGQVDSPSGISAGQDMASGIGQAMLKKVGLDQAARQRMSQMIQQKIANGRNQQQAQRDSGSASSKLSSLMRDKEDKVTNKITDKLFGEKDSLGKSGSGRNFKESLVSNESKEVSPDPASKSSDSGAPKTSFRDKLSNVKDKFFKKKPEDAAKNDAQDKKEASKESEKNDKTDPKKKLRIIEDGKGGLKVAEVDLAEEDKKFKEQKEKEGEKEKEDKTKKSSKESASKDRKEASKEENTSDKWNKAEAKKDLKMVYDDTEPLKVVDRNRSERISIGSHRQKPAEKTSEAPKSDSNDDTSNPENSSSNKNGNTSGWKRSTPSKGATDTSSNSDSAKSKESKNSDEPNDKGAKE
jgi:type IV secretion system protein VirB6